MWKLVREEGCLGARYSELIPALPLCTIDAVELACNQADPWKERPLLRAKARAEAELKFGIVPMPPVSATN